MKKYKKNYTNITLSFYKRHTFLIKNIIFIALFLILSYYISLFSHISKNKVSVSFINVGQGDATLISLQNNMNILYDTGKESFGIENIEKSLDTNILQREFIDTLIISHSDLDHAGKAEYFINKFDIKNILLNNKIYYTNNYIKDAINVYAGQYLEYYNYNNTSTSTIHFINPLKNEFYTDENEGSVGIILNYNNFNFIMMADIGKEYETKLLANGYLDRVIKRGCPDCINILKVGHHGSKTSSDESFIKALDPEYCVISLGKNNYGHPNPEVLKTLQKYCNKIYRTDEYGTITFEMINDNLKIKHKK